MNTQSTENQNTTKANLSQNPPRYAGFGIRFVAFIIDSLLAMLLIAPLIGLIISTDVRPQDFLDIRNIMVLDLETMLSFVYNQLVNTLITIAVIILFWIYRSATPGKMILGLTIVDANSLQPLSKGQCFVRYLGYYLAAIPLFIGLFFVIMDTKKQGWHDKIAKTLVIYTENKTPES